MDLADDVGDGEGAQEEQEAVRPVGEGDEAREVARLLPCLAVVL